VTDDVPSICMKRRFVLFRWLFGEYDDLEDRCEQDGGYCSYCHSRIAGGGPF